MENINRRHCDRHDITYFENIGCPECYDEKHGPMKD
jgi:hypothetical protein